MDGLPLTVGCITMIASGVLGAYLDISGAILKPPAYWALGTSGLMACVFTAVIVKWLA